MYGAHPSFLRSRAKVDASQHGSTSQPNQHWLFIVPFAVSLMMTFIRETIIAFMSWFIGVYSNPLFVLQTQASGLLNDGNTDRRLMVIIPASLA